jgi:signal transduction histidine kinase
MRRTFPLSGRVVAIVIALHAVILPLLYVELDHIVSLTHIETFTDYVRSYARHHADELSSRGAALSEEGRMDFLDSLMLGGDVVYARIRDGDRVVRDRIGAPGDPVPLDAEDFKFGEDGDKVYSIAASFSEGSHPAVLQLGFDERPTLARIRETRQRILAAFMVYLVVIIALAILLATHLARPLDRLRQLSRSIASGNFAENLTISTGIREVSELADDLDIMRRELLGANARLRQKQRLETVGTLAGGMAHEFNNVLVPIILFSEAALDRVPTPHPARQMIERALGAARRAGDVISKILAFEGRQRPATGERIDVAAAVEEGLRLFRALCPSSVELRSLVDPGCTGVVAETTSIVQIVMNLCTNAYQSLPQAGGTIDVKLANRTISEGSAAVAEPGDYVELTVSDNGHGIDAATLERIFEPFFTTRDVGEGTGLGLSAVHGIVTSLGGVINVESSTERGSTFRVLFPATTGH